MYSCGPLHMDEKRLVDQLEIIYSNSEPIQDVAWNIRLEQWTIETGGERRSGKSVLAARHDDDDDDDNNLLHNFSEHGIKYLRETCKKKCCHEFFFFFFACISSRTRRIVRIWDDIDSFPWFFGIIFSTSGRIRLRSRVPELV